jgi:hypothetical protein
VSAATERIELFNLGNTPVLKDAEGREVVVFTYNGMNRIEGLEAGRRVLVADFEVSVAGRKMGAALASYVTVESVYDRSLVQSRQDGVLRVVQGDVLTILGEHRFLVERLWHRDQGDVMSSIVFAHYR